MTTSLVSLQRLVVLWWFDCMEPQKRPIKTQPLVMWAYGCPTLNYTAGKPGLYFIYLNSLLVQFLQESFGGFFLVFFYLNR